MKATPGILIAAGFLVIPFSFSIGITSADEHFEKRIRPVLETRCLSCHGPDRQDGSLRLDSRGAIVPERLARLARGDSEAPASCRLSPLERQDFVNWIEAGLPWPEGISIAPQINRAEATRDHWAFQPVTEPAIPPVDDAAWLRSPIDAFVLRGLENAGLKPSPEADRRTLIRRLSYTLTGLPPSPKDIDAFLADRSPAAYRNLVDRLLESPQYGVHWARHWLDVARYSDTKGYIYAREERFWTHAWAYRDWVVDAMNRDLPYDQFLLLQLAADQLVEDRHAEDLAAMGFLTLGRRFLGVERDIIDDRIDVVTRGTMALTVGCARCHDHKYDPIPTADYYSLYGVFASSRETLTPIGDLDAGGKAFQEELAKRRNALRKKTIELREAGSQRARERIADYLFAQTERKKYPANGFDQIFAKTDLLPAFVHRWTEFLRKAKQRKDPIFLPWQTYAALPEENFSEAARKIGFKTGSVHPIVARAFATPPETIREVADRYGRIFADIDAQWKTALADVEKKKTDPLSALDDPDAEVLRKILYGPDAPAAIPDLPIVHCETFLDSGSVTALWKLEGEVYRWLIRQPAEAPHALILQDREFPVEPRIFRRGNPLDRGEEIPRQFLALLEGDDRKPFAHGSGRLEMAKAIADPANPLTARVIVNRVWGHHFGQGLVTTPSDFGLRADPPSHPKLLDWLASRFVAEGWSLKKLHRVILLSSTWRQASEGPRDAAIRERAMQRDPGNRLLWRMTPRRLSWEQFRDSMLAASEDLDLTRGGKPVTLLAEPYPKRRTLYGLVDRQFLPVLLRTFDFANPDLHIPKRAQTTVPQQALFFMNHPLVLERARSLAAYAETRAETPEEKIHLLFRRSWQRAPSETESTEALALIRAIGAINPDKDSVTAKDWLYGYGAFDEDSQQVAGFTRLPHFTGEAWQGSEKWPDAKLGWVQLTAAGGHPGNHRQHAAIRRWTAPHDMTISIRSKLVHEPQPGDGIRAFIISSRAGKLASATIHQKTINLDLDSLEVAKGETIDFVVDIGEVLNSDQYLWRATVTETSARERSSIWNSEADFPRNIALKLTAWEQLAHTLLCSNEFLFVD